MLSSPLVLPSLFSDSDISRLLADTHTSSSLRSQQALVDVVSLGAGARSHCSSPFRSPSRSSPSRRKHRESGSPARSGKRVCSDSSAPNSALKGLKSGFRRWGSCLSSAIGGCLGDRWETLESLGDLGKLGARSVGRGGPALRLQDPFSCSSFSLDDSDPPSQLFADVHQGNRVDRCSDRLDCEGSCRTCSVDSGLLQTVICYPQSHQGLTPGYRFLASQLLGACLIFTWRRLNRSFSLFIKETGWCPWISRKHTFRFRCTRPLGTT